jgi:hypothetical protein
VRYARPGGPEPPGLLRQSLRPEPGGKATRALDPEMAIKPTGRSLPLDGVWSVIRLRGISIVELIDIDSFPDTPPHRKVLLLVLLLALKDHATEFHFEPWRSEEPDDGEMGLRMFYKVDGQLLELVPPPACLASPLFRDLEDVSGLNTPRRRIADLLRRLASMIDGEPRPPRRGQFRLGHASGNSDVEVMAHDSELGERYFLKLSPTPERTWEAETNELKRLFRIMSERRSRKAQSSGI